MSSRWGIASLLVAFALPSAGCTELLLGDKSFVETDGAGHGGAGGATGATGGATTSAGGSSPVCEDGATACDGKCVLLDSDPGNCGACGHDCLGAACQSGLCAPQEIATALNDPRGLATDESHVYWTTGDGEVQRAPKAGGVVETLAENQDSPGALAVDATTIYWVNDETGRVMRLPKDGQGKPKSILKSPGLAGLTVDADGLYLSRKLKKGEIRRADKDGGGASTVASKQAQPSRICVLGDRVIWAGQIEEGDDEDEDGTPDGEQGKAGGYVRSAARAGGDVTTLAHGEGQISDLVMAGETTVWSDAKSHSLRALLPGAGEPITLVEEQDVRGLAAAGGDVFWTSSGGTLKRISASGGAPRVIAVDIPGAGAAAVDGTHVYFTRSGPAGIIYRVAR